jgi:hypothetical protein
LKAWMVGAVLLTFACIAALASSPVFTGTWIVKNKNVGIVQAIVFTVGIAETGPVLRIREVSAPREDQELYNAIHEAARISQSNGPSMDDALKENMHWGGERSWCDREDCHRLYIFVGTSLKRVRDAGPSAICQLPTPSIAKDSRRIQS